MSEDQTLDYYELLGVPVNASHEQIKNAYRQLAMEWHPDRNADAIAPDAMLLLNEAWEVLGDEKLRADYDRQRVLARSNVAEAARQRQQEKTEKAENGDPWSSGIVEPPWYRATEDEVDRATATDGDEQNQTGCGPRGCLWAVGIVVGIVLLIGLIGSCNESECERAFRDAGVYERFIPQYCD